MPYLRPLQQLRQQFEELTDTLNVCQNSGQRKELLKRMKALIDETDKLITREVLRMDSTPDRSNPR
jgi:CHASE3 domain sensor protein